MTRHITDPVQISNRLRDLGLDPELVVDAVRASASARNSASPHHPAWFPGTWAHAEAVRTLRDGAVGHGWVASRDNGLEQLLDDAGENAILVCTGDVGTGHPDRATSTKYPRGPASQTALQKNQLSMMFPGEQEDKPGRRVKTWILLIHQTADSVFSELSLADSITEQGHIATWAERICMPTLELGPEQTRDSSPIEPTDEVDLEVRRRG